MLWALVLPIVEQEWKMPLRNEINRPKSNTRDDLAQLHICTSPSLLIIFAIAYIDVRGRPA